MTLYSHTFPTPFGDFSVAHDSTGALVATAFGTADSLRTRLKPWSTFRAGGDFTRVENQVLGYFGGERQGFDLPLAPSGTEFQRQVWNALLEIPFGETRSYGQIAARLSRPSASRAVGRANATNPICLIVPCHRVIGADGSLTGFAFGEELKRRLLDHERARAAARTAA